VLAHPVQEVGEEVADAGEHERGNLVGGTRVGRGISFSDLVD
jgi:hypothetical protein